MGTQESSLNAHEKDSILLGRTGGLALKHFTFDAPELSLLGGSEPTDLGASSFVPTSSHRGQPQALFQSSHSSEVRRRRGRTYQLNRRVLLIGFDPISSHLENHQFIPPPLGAFLNLTSGARHSTCGSYPKEKLQLQIPCSTFESRAALSVSIDRPGCGC